MKQITIVTFRAFDKQFQKHFIDKSNDQIHAELSNICSTYVVLSMEDFEITNYRLRPLSELESLLLK